MAAGLLGFPTKDLQHRFLCLFRPVFYIRQRDYSKVNLADAIVIDLGTQAWGLV